MADRTGISWTNATWNPVRGCSRVSEGCRNCYAERTAARFCGAGQPYEGLATSTRTLTGNTRSGYPGFVTRQRWTGDVRLVPEHLADPLRWRRPRRIFVNSMSDLFHEKLSNEQIAAVFGVMAAAPQHTFQCLTKRARRMREWFEWVEREAAKLGPDGFLRAHVCASEAHEILRERDIPTIVNCQWPLPNVHLGVSTENQPAFDERWPDLFACPAAVWWFSAEPLLGDIDLTYMLADFACKRGKLWLVAGCESGPGSRPCEVAWLRSLRHQCAKASVPFFLKQAGEQDYDAYQRTVIERGDLRKVRVIGAGDGSRRKAGGVIELPYLDGVQHAAFPTVSP